MTVRGSCAIRRTASGTAAGAEVVVVIVDVWQAATAPARTMRSRFMTLSFGTRDCMRAERSAIVAPLPLRRGCVDHRVHELSRAVPVRRGALRGEAVQENQVREVRQRLRYS